MTALRTGTRYLLVAGVCMIAHVAVMIVADGAGMVMPAAMLLSFLLTGAIGFALHCRFTFAAAARDCAMLRYYLAMAPNLPASTLLLWVLNGLLGWPMPIAAPAGAVTMTLVNFLTSRWAITGRSGAAIP